MKNLKWFGDYRNDNADLVGANSNVLTVGTGKQFSLIADAVAYGVQNFDRGSYIVVSLSVGTHSLTSKVELLEHNVYIAGAGKDLTFITNDTGESYPISSSRFGYVRISGFTITGGGLSTTSSMDQVSSDPIKIVNAPEAAIFCLANGSFVGPSIEIENSVGSSVYVLSGASVVIPSSKITGGVRGVLATGRSYVEVGNSDIRDTAREGVYATIGATIDCRSTTFNNGTFAMRAIYGALVYGQGVTNSGNTLASPAVNTISAHNSYIYHS